MGIDSLTVGTHREFPPYPQSLIVVEFSYIVSLFLLDIVYLSPLDRVSLSPLDRVSFSILVIFSWVVPAFSSCI